MGKGNVINADDIAVVLFPKSADCKRRVKEAEEKGNLIRLNRQRKIRSVIITKSGFVMPCMLSYDALLNRLNGRGDKKYAFVPPEEDPGELPDDETDEEETE